MKILALDIATKCGWALSPELSGVWDLSIKRDESGGMRLVRFRAKLSELYRSESFDLVVFESANIYGQARMNGALIQVEMQGVLKLWCEERRIDSKGYSPSAIKKHATGKGNAKKPDMVEAARRRGWSVIDDNHADALWLLDYANFDLGLALADGVAH